MKKTINNQLIKSLKPQEKAFEVRDNQLKGLLLRVQPTGTMTFYLEYERGKRYKIGRCGVITPQKAREIAKQKLAVAYQGGDPMKEKREKKTMTLSEFLDEVYTAWTNQNHSKPEMTIDRLKKSFSSFQKKRLNEIQLFQIEKWRSNRLKGGTSKSTINRELADLKACLKRAAVWGYIESDPIKSIKHFRLDNNAIIRFLSENEEYRLRQELNKREDRIRKGRDSGNEWRKEREYELYEDLKNKTFADHLKPMILLSLNTGMRRGELFQLTWECVNLEQVFITVSASSSKSGKTRHIPLNTEALKTLKEWRNQTPNPTGLVFPNDKGNPFDNVNSSWRKLLCDSKIKKFRWHDLRHTFASKLVQAGVDLNTVRELLGHSNYRMTLKYAHLAPEHKAAAVAKLCSPKPLKEVL